MSASQGRALVLELGGRLEVASLSKYGVTEGGVQSTRDEGGRIRMGQDRLRIGTLHRGT
jgi:hypothetical protein